MTTPVIIIIDVHLPHRRSKLPHLRSLAGTPLPGSGRLIKIPDCSRARLPSPHHRQSRRDHRLAPAHTPPSGQSSPPRLRAPKGGWWLGSRDLREVDSISPTRLRVGRARRGLRRLAVATSVIRLGLGRRPGARRALEGRGRGSRTGVSSRRGL
jgi:hypothetical protein